MMSVYDAETVLRAHIARAEAETSWWQVALKAALKFLLSQLPKLLPLILADAQMRGVVLSDDALTMVRQTGKHTRTQG